MTANLNEAPVSIRMPAKKILRAAMFDQGGVPTIACVNKSVTKMGVDFEAMIAALQKSVDRAFAPVWGTQCRLKITKSLPNDGKTWGMVFTDNADVANALGYHDLQTGAPISYVFVKTSLDNGEAVSVTASHELFEMLVDPGIQMWAQGPANVLYAYETADAVEATSFLVDKIPISNFVYPSWFEQFRKGTKPTAKAKFDHLGRCTSPFQLLPGGYSIVMKNGKVSQVFGSQLKRTAFAKENRTMHRSEYRLPVKA